MFEDSTFESMGRIHTRSRLWMIFTFVINGSVLLALILIPLVFPDALPRHVLPALVVAPATPAPEHLPPAHDAAKSIHNASEIPDGHIIAPTGIPPRIRIFTEREEPLRSPLLTMDQGPSIPGGGENPFGNRRPVIVAHSKSKGPVRVSSGVMSGLLIRKTIPSYPSIAKAMGIQGTVVLQATISKSGTIENLRVVSGPAVLQQAAVDAVRSWRYSPYLLSQEPVAVETSINVIFTVAR
jgi:protein TonB